MKLRIKEHVPKCVENFVTNKIKKTTTAIRNAAKRSAIAEHLINNPTCAQKYSESNFKILRQCWNSFELVKLEAILIHLNKPDLCKQKEFDYIVSLFN